MKAPCEYISRYFLPTIRSILAKKLVEEYGYTQTAAAKKLGLSQSAMSRYLSMERGVKKKIPNELLEVINATAKRLAESSISTEESSLLLCSICSKYRNLQTK
ncbi:MAG: helix-turn-helix domain-containing protein [Candidatus Methanomethylicaceae archaeon]